MHNLSEVSANTSGHASRRSHVSINTMSHPSAFIKLIEESDVMLDLTDTVLKQVQLQYLAPLELYESVKPYSLASSKCYMLPRTNVQTTTYDNVRISNIRGHFPEFSLETSGFEYLKHETECNFDSKQAIEEDYVDEMAEVLKNRLNAQSVYIFDYTV